MTVTCGKGAKANRIYVSQYFKFHRNFVHRIFAGISYHNLLDVLAHELGQRVEKVGFHIQLLQWRMANITIMQPYATVLGKGAQNEHLPIST